MNASISSVSGPSPVVAIENDSRSRSTSTTQAANASATQSSKSADKSKKSQTLGDTVELSRSLDLTLGQDLLQSSIGRKIDAMFEEYGIDMDAYEGQDMSVEATVATALPMTAHIAIKDTIETDQGCQFVLPGESHSFDYADLFRRFYAGGYRADICCEVSGMVSSQAGYDPIAAAKTKTAEPLSVIMPNAIRIATAARVGR